MAGFAARTGVAEGDHDALTVRALSVDDTAVVTVDVIGIDANLSARARARLLAGSGYYYTSDAYSRWTSVDARKIVCGG